jgi:hypothetical protein
VKSWLPLNAGPEKSGWEIVAPAGALELVVINPACADMASDITVSPIPKTAHFLFIVVLSTP